MAVVLFDIGNVLVKLRFERGIARLAALSGRCSPHELRALMHSPLKQANDRGDHDERTFLRELSAAIGAPGVDPRALVSAWVDIFDRWPEAEALLEDVLTAGHRVILMSNTDAIHMAHLRRTVPLLERVHGAHLSYEAHVLKPDPAFFTGAIARFQLDPAQCMFVDDLAENVAAAAAVGLPSVQHLGDVDAIRSEIASRGVRWR